MYNQEQHPILGHSDCSIPILLIDTCVFDANKPIEEDLASDFEAHAMLALVREIFRRVPLKLEIAHGSIVIQICKYIHYGRALYYAADVPVGLCRVPHVSILRLGAKAIAQV